MIKLKKIIFVLLIISLLLASGCKKTQKDPKKQLEELKTGTEGISLSFVPNSPPDIVHIEPTVKNFDVMIEIKNKGAYPAADDPRRIEGRLYLSGYDQNLVQWDRNNVDLGSLLLPSKSQVNLQGGFDVAAFKAEAQNLDSLNVEKYEPILLATACYKYETAATASVCIDPNPYSTVKEKKVCQVHDITLSSQGAPVAVTKIEETASYATTQFKVTIKNVGTGDVLKFDQLEKCNPTGTARLEREDIDKVHVERIAVGQQELLCWPFVDVQDSRARLQSGFIRLINNEGSVTCELQKKDQSGYAGGNTAYITPMTIRLKYGYKAIAEKKIQIKVVSQQK